MQQKFPQSSASLRVLAVFLTCSFFAVAAMAQEKAANVAPASQAGTVAAGGDSAAGKPGISSHDPAARKTAMETPGHTSTPVTKSNDSTAPGASNVATDYKKTLNNLETLYEGQVQRLEQQNNQAKGLYSEGLISRVEMEKSDKDLADARAKVEQARNLIAAANKPARALPDAPADFVASNAAWSTGNKKVDNLVRYYGNKYGVDHFLIFCLMSQESNFRTLRPHPQDAHAPILLIPVPHCTPG